jgi:hypothetical protein
MPLIQLLIVLIVVGVLCSQDESPHSRPTEGLEWVTRRFSHTSA